MTVFRAGAYPADMSIVDTVDFAEEDVVVLKATSSTVRMRYPDGTIVTVSGRGMGYDFQADAPTGWVTGISATYGGKSIGSISKLWIPLADVQSMSDADFENALLGGDDQFYGSAYADVLLAGTGNDLVSGMAGNDVLRGEAGNDTLIGGAGTDTLDGGDGDDVYVLTAADLLDEIVDSSGTDAIHANFSFSLDNSSYSAIETLRLTGSAAISATGNGNANLLIGNGAANRLDGAGGADTLQGGAGNDVYLAVEAADTIVEGAKQGTDRVETAENTYALGNNLENLLFNGTGAFIGTGNALANVITGGGGSDQLDGGLGRDRLIGGGGDDTYYVDNAGDVVIEKLGEGTDTVLVTAAKYSLSADVENMTFAGSTKFVGTGNKLDNVITGGGMGDTLRGGDGNDRLIGGAGDDLLYGDRGNDTLVGGAGNDVLAGGLGNDLFVYDGGADKILDFRKGGLGADVIDLSNFGLTYDQLVTSYVAGGFKIEFGNGDVLTVLGAKYADLSESWFQL